MRELSVVESWMRNSLNEFQTNLVPFPRLHFPLASYSPLSASSSSSHGDASVWDVTASCFGSRQGESHLVHGCDMAAGR